MIALETDSTANGNDQAAETGGRFVQADLTSRDDVRRLADEADAVDAP